MIHRFIPELLQVPETEVEVGSQPGHYTTIIKVPAPDPRDRIYDEYDEYDDDSNQSE